MITVVAAIIRQNGRLLICQRRRDDRFPLKWEFPGGKVAAGETPEQALARELEEELGVRAAVGREVLRTRYRYSEMADELELIFFATELTAGPVRNLAFDRIEWAAAERLSGYDFLPADRELVERLAAGTLRAD
jgi:8-oxo-dGTP diphosphatase